MRQLPDFDLHCTTTDDKLGNEKRVRDLVGKTVQGGPGYTGTITIEGRIFEGSWFSLGTVAAGAKLAIDGAGLQTLAAIRTNCTTVTGGDPPTAKLAAFDARDAG